MYQYYKKCELAQKKNFGFLTAGPPPYHGQGRREQAQETNRLTQASAQTRPLRAWQRRALAKYLSSAPTDFLAVATPGSGKTTFGLRIAAELLADRTVDQVTVVTPTEHLKHQWAASAEAAGLLLDSRFSNAVGATSSDNHGVVVTYAQVAAHPARHRVRTERRRTLVLLDEVHHAGDAKSWGEATREAFEGAERRVALTGTPFRSDDNPIPFVRYEPVGDGSLMSRSDHHYGYAQALADGVVRPVVFLAYSGEARWRSNAGDEYAARLGDPLTREHTARAWRTALDPHGDWIPAVFAAAHRRLEHKRASGMPDAGGLVIATDQDKARAYAVRLREITGEAPTVVVSDDPSASAKIAEFSKGTSKWLVAVRMVSEGVDVPRLCVGVYATSSATPLYFAQAVGRFVRARRPGETASVFLPSVPVLLGLASELEAQRDHVLGAPKRHEEGWEDELLSEANRTQSTADLPPEAFEALGAQAELDQVIYDGNSFGTATFAGSDEEADYLGLPGLLDAEQMRALLSKRQEEQLARRSQVVVAPEPARLAGGDGKSLADLRRELNALVAAYHHRTGKPHGVVHTELRAKLGGPAVAAASAHQLKERIELLRTWARSG
ncbi:type III restriction protein res subunit [Segniliparus rotundus DSM 44985]|uniref:Type III restriction protein res subunit n=1 Tax=Segniliparus rotundus (strain ATCC BAA-972 / CDC 1076 / CIP 108378 / DSM 44985 / JCM 13578) TaxID=640132 RepID=D6Z955_SEGRD|nr:type III restriction protein res subunit [Segniliparus rotundus DSM 44985]